MVVTLQKLTDAQAQCLDVSLTGEAADPHGRGGQRNLFFVLCPGLVGFIGPFKETNPKSELPLPPCHPGNRPRVPGQHVPTTTYACEPLPIYLNLQTY